MTAVLPGWREPMSSGLHGRGTLRALVPGLSIWGIADLTFHFLSCSDIDAIETLRIREIADAPLPAYYGRVKSRSCLPACILEIWLT
jgi:hypothetical protein